jgi:uncharacterized membrane protein
MKDTKTIMSSALAGVLALGLTAAGSETYAGPVAQPKGAERCYGAAKVGKNDCQTSSSACAGTSTQDSQHEALTAGPPRMWWSRGASTASAWRRSRPS